MQEQRGYRIKGRVQGVGFRWWTRRLGLQMRLRGDVRNRTDGSVEVHARGAREDLDAFAERLLMGPPGSRVDSVEEVPSAEDTPELGFLIEGR